MKLEAQAESSMRLTIFLDIGEVNSLRESMPQQSSAGEALERALQTKNYWGSVGRDVVVDCADHAAYELLGYARSACPSAVEKIRAAFSLGELRNSPRSSQRP
jgi:hypothetical protein